MTEPAPSAVRAPADSDTPIRLPSDHDTARLRELAVLAHPSATAEDVDVAGRIREDIHGKDAMRHSDGEPFVIPYLHTLRVIARPAQQARAFVLCAPPLGWTLKQGNSRGGLTLEERCQLSAALVECELLATLPRWRGRGYAGRLLADAEDRYRAAGWRVMFAVIGRQNRTVADWYRARGYTVGEPDRPALVQFWSDRIHETGIYGPPDITPGQTLGFKALAPHIKITDLGGTIHISGLLDLSPEGGRS